MKFKKLKDFSKERDELLTIRITEAWLDRSDSSRENNLFIEVERDSEILTSSKEREKHFKSVDPGWFEKRLISWHNKNCKLTRIANKKHPLEGIVADICLILEIEGKSYLLSFYRDIYPEGWVFPGGCPNSLEEIFNPRIVAIRELTEEVLITDICGRVYSFFNAEKLIRKKIVRLVSDYRKFVFPSAQPLFPKVGDAENLIILMNGKERHVRANIVIYPQTGTISAVFFRKVILPVRLSELRIFDGEEDKEGKIVNRPIRLLNLEDGSVEALFVSGRNILAEEWNTSRIKQLVNILQM
ncbi:hypothetical protein J7K24_02065 [bacterium]|nr:hypothetical protein [bacterium]